MLGNHSWPKSEVYQTSCPLGCKRESCTMQNQSLPSQNGWCKNRNRPQLRYGYFLTSSLNSLLDSTSVENVTKLERDQYQALLVASGAMKGSASRSLEVLRKTPLKTSAGARHPREIHMNTKETGKSPHQVNCGKTQTGIKLHESHSKHPNWITSWLETNQKV